MRRISVPLLAALAAYACGPRDPSTPPGSGRAPGAAASTPPASPVLTPAAESRVHAEHPALPVGITSFGAARLDSRVYVLAGWMGEPHAYDTDHQSDAFLRADLVPAAGSPTEAAQPSQWTAAPNLGRMQSPALVAVGDGLVATGGLVAHNRTGSPAELESLAKVARFDPAASRWTELVPMPEPRSSHDAALVDGELWVVGGWRIDRAGESRWHSTALHRDADRDDAPWVSVDVPIQRRAHAVVGLPGRVIVVGGMTPQGPTNRVDMLDVAAGTWSEAPGLPGVGFGVAAVAYGATVIASGADGVLWQWTPGDAAWRGIGRLAFPRFFHRMVVDADGGIVVVGGIAGSGSGQKIRATERVVPGAAAHLVALTVDAPGTAKNRQGLLLHDDRLMVIGGNTSLEQHDFAAERFVAESHELALGTLTWRERAPLPARRQSLLATTTSGDGAIVVGGFGHDGTAARTWADGWIYDFAADRWSALAQPLPGTRSQAGLVEHDGRLWLLGGLDYDPARPEKDRFRHPRRVLSSAVAPVEFGDAPIELPRSRRAFGGALQGGEYFMVGGLADGFANVAPCEAIALSTGKVRPIACPSRARLSPELVATGGTLILAGGMVDGAPDTSIERYDPETNTWTTLEFAMPLPIPHLRLLSWGDRVLAFSAHDADPDIHLAILTLPPSPEPRR